MVIVQIIADLQIHSKYSRATSKNISLESLAKGAKLKGINLLGTGDCTHPLWLKEIKETLEPLDDSGIYRYQDIFWIITGEVNTVYEYDKKIRKVHHLFYVPSIEIAEQIIDVLSKYENLKSDGRPTFNNINSPELVEILMNISKNIIVLPSHAWTPWFSVFGSRSGFDSLKECYQDQTKNIFALETGLSSDPQMNWRLSSLDDITLMSNSDSHSSNPWRIGREANVFELDELSYKEIYQIIKNKDRKRFLFTIETEPSYGKYHFSGHRKCGISLHPKDAIKLNNICPKCKKELTVGVLQRVEELADRPEGYIPKNAIPFKTLLPLYEIISYVIGKGKHYSKKVLLEYDKLIKKFNNEFNVLLNITKEELENVTSQKIAEAIIKVREGKVKYIPGFDGQYGIPVFDENFTNNKEFFTQKSLKEF